METHNLSKHPLYRTWNNMTQRANKHKRYIGIFVCDEWLSFINFYNWSIANNWELGLEIDRIDNLKGYSPDNCKWSTRQQQTRNTSRNRYFEYNNEKLLLVELCEKYNINRNTFNKRLRLGWTIDKIIETPKIDSKNRMLGTKLTQETKDKIREKLKGNNNRIKNYEQNNTTTL
jgi:hypothetical protein